MLKATVLLAFIVAVYAGTVSHSSANNNDVVKWLEKLEERLKVVEEKGIVM